MNHTITTSNVLINWDKLSHKSDNHYSDLKLKEFLNELLFEENYEEATLIRNELIIRKNIKN